VDFRRRGLDRLRWTEVQMPNELAMLGLPVKQDVEYLLRRTCIIPPDMAGRAITLRFDGVYNYARVWVNGHYVRDHFGGFTSWDCEITPYVRAGDECEILIVLVDRSDDPSWGSGYAGHCLAGILRDVSLVALPMVHIKELCLSSSLDDRYLTGVLELQANLSSQDTSSNAEISVSLRDPNGNDVPIDFQSPIRIGDALRFDPIRLPNVRRWDSEHPNLYELAIEVRSNFGLETLKRSIGFRKIERVDNQLLVNGDPVVLRGVCRHDVDPIRGRSPSPIHDRGDPVLLKRANLNFIRTSHYPPSEAFLSVCDRVGMYVEEETAVAFALFASRDDPKQAGRFTGQFAEMIGRDHWHPSVIMWSLGNESRWGRNFSKEVELARRTDPTRPVIFSWSDTTGEDQRLLDIYSSHYPTYDSDLGSEDFPVLHDEMAHVPCYNVEGLRLDPGVRSFWGQSIAMFGKKLLDSPGCIGGAIWGGIDEVFLLPDRITGSGPWGILDGWRREKPEFWLARKAFSPIRVEDGVLPLVQKGEQPVVTVGNGHNHTNLQEFSIQWAVGDRHGTIQGLDIPPHTASQVRIPVSGVIATGDVLDLRFLSRDGSEIDRFKLPLGARAAPIFPREDGVLHLQTNRDLFIVSSPRFLLTLDRKNGHIRDCVVNARSVIVGGPLLNLGQGRPNKWVLSKMDVKELSRSMIFVVSGESGHPHQKIRLEYELEVFGDGRIDLRYRLVGRQEIDKLGLGFVLPASVDRLMWHRRALWSVYPDDHIGRPMGTAYRTSMRAAAKLRTAPEWSWGEDMYEPFLDGYKIPVGNATNDFRSLKENVFWAGCFQGEAQEHLRVESQGDVAVRASPQPDGKVDLNIYNFWRYPELKYGNYVGPSLSTAFVEKGRPTPPPEYKISLRATDTARVKMEPGSTGS